MIRWNPDDDMMEHPELPVWCQHCERRTEDYDGYCSSCGNHRDTSPPTWPEDEEGGGTWPRSCDHCAAETAFIVLPDRDMWLCAGCFRDAVVTKTKGIQ